MAGKSPATKAASSTPCDSNRKNPSSHRGKREGGGNKASKKTTICPFDSATVAPFVPCCTRESYADETSTRPGWIRTTCYLCGSFIGYRPINPKKDGQYATDADKS